MRKSIAIFFGFAPILFGQTASMPDTVAFIGGSVSIPVMITDVVDLEGLELTVQYDETVLTAMSTSFENTELDGMNFNVELNLDTSGEIRVVAYAGNQFFSGGGNLLFINFDVIGELLESTNLTYTSIEINNNSILESVLNGSVIVHQSGCGDVNACNYDADYTGSSGSCIYENDCAGVCGGAAEFDDCNSPICSGGITGFIANASCTDCNGELNGIAIADCNDVCEGTAALDDCIISVCSGGNTGLIANFSCTDCNNVINGFAEIDGCGNCVGGNTELLACPLDCSGVYGGTAEFDDCTTPVCSGGTTGLEANSTCTDCFDVVNGTAEFDDCTTPVCSGGTTGLEANSTCLDCSGVPNGDAVEDDCGTCDLDSSNDCIQDCVGEWGGDAWVSDCGCVAADNSGYDCDDCADVPNGVALIDECDVCNEPICHSDGVPSPFTAGKNPCDSGLYPISPLWNLTCLDCAGTPNGDAVEDICGVCGGAGCHQENCETYPADQYDCYGVLLTIDLFSPFEFKLLPNYPNPFNPSTTINYSISTFSAVNVSIFSMSGKLIHTLVNTSQQPGQYAAQWDALNYPSGLYLVKLISENKIAEQKVLLIK